LRKAIITLAIVVLGLISGCNRTATPSEKKLFLNVDFKEADTLRYKFVSSKDIELDWDPSNMSPKTRSKGGKSKSTEYFEMVVGYTPISVDAYGLTTIQAKCESVKIHRTPAQKGSDNDAATNFEGKTFTFIVTPTGKFEDRSQLEKLVKEVAQKAFHKHPKLGRIKEPEMILDFIATQWFLWDSVSSIEKPLDGLETGQSWESVLSVPNPTMLRRARQVTYQLREIRKTPNGRIAVISSTYTPAEAAPKSWPSPFDGRFQVSGTFGFLISFVKGFDMVGLEGQGEELFNIDTGMTENYKQQYQARFAGTEPMSLGIQPQITINQKLTMQILPKK